jgi:hypothetical protein
VFQIADDHIFVVKRIVEFLVALVRFRFYVKEELKPLNGAPSYLAWGLRITPVGLTLRN